MRTKSKLILSATSLLALGVVAATSATVAWYSSQARVTLNYTHAHIQAPTSKLAIGAWNPYGSTFTLDDAVSSTATGSFSVQLTDVMSINADKLPSASNIRTYATVDDDHAVQSSCGKHFGKYSLSKGTDASKVDGDDVLYDVSNNPNVKAVGSNETVSVAMDSTVGADLDLMSVQPGRAYVRFGFYLENIDEAPIDISCMPATNESYFGVTHAKITESPAAYCLIKQVATTDITPGSEGGKDSCTFANIPVGSAISEATTPVAGTSYAALNGAFGSELKDIDADGKVYYCVTIWVDGTRFDTNDAYPASDFSVGLVFTAVAHVEDASA